MASSHRKIGVVTRNQELIDLVRGFLEAQVLCACLEDDTVDMAELSSMVRDSFGRDCSQVLIDCEGIREISTLGWAYLTIIADDGVDVIMINLNEALCQRAQTVKSYTRRKLADRLRFYDGMIDEERLRHVLSAL